MLHVDLDPFFVSVERSLDPSLRSRPLVIGGDGSGTGFVAAASEEARAAGVRAGMALLQAQHLCPDAAFRRGDLDTYGRIGEEVTAVLLAASRRVERPSADEAFVDLSPEHGSIPPVRVTHPTPIRRRAPTPQDGSGGLRRVGRPSLGRGRGATSGRPRTTGGDEEVVFDGNAKRRESARPRVHATRPGVLSLELVRPGGSSSPGDPTADSSPPNTGPRPSKPAASRT